MNAELPDEHVRVDASRQVRRTNLPRTVERSRAQLPMQMTGRKVWSALFNSASVAVQTTGYSQVDIV